MKDAWIAKIHIYSPHVQNTPSYCDCLGTSPGQYMGRCWYMTGLHKSAKIITVYAKIITVYYNLFKALS
jgi:hypothetical protein